MKFKVIAKAEIDIDDILEGMSFEDCVKLVKHIHNAILNDNGADVADDFTDELLKIGLAEKVSYMREWVAEDIDGGYDDGRIEYHTEILGALEILANRYGVVDNPPQPV